VFNYKNYTTLYRVMSSVFATIFYIARIMPMGPLNDLLVYATMFLRGPIGTILACPASSVPSCYSLSGTKAATIFAIADTVVTAP
jgi:hypothetical protein